MESTAQQNSWLGGLPRLPDEIDWPVNPDTGLALHHLAQIDLSEMPQIDVRHQLPKTGMLWFFADIDSELTWGVGPDMTQARVIYHPDNSGSRTLHDLPAHLPQVDHESGEMEVYPLSIRPAPFHTYPRWPVTGHRVLTWDQETLPDGVAWESGYVRAVVDRMKAEREGLLGPMPERRGGLPGPLRQDRDDQGKTQWAYEPVADHGTYPFIHALGAEVIRALRFQVLCQLQQYQNTIKWSPRQIAEYEKKQRDTGPIEKNLPEAEAHVLVFEQALAALGDLHDDLISAAPTAPLGADMQARFNRLIRDYGFGQLNRIDARDAISRGQMRMMQRMFDEPELATALPDGFLAGFRKDHSPWSIYGAHYLLGAKAVSSNPTAGKGVRLAQFDTDYGMDFMFCDCGIIDFWIDADDLAKGRWDRAWAATAGG